MRKITTAITALAIAGTALVGTTAMVGTTPAFAGTAAQKSCGHVTESVAYGSAIVRADVTALTLERANGSLPSRTPCWMARKAVRKVLRAGAGVPRVRVGGRTFKRWDDALYVGGYRGVEFSTRTVG